MEYEIQDSLSLLRISWLFSELELSKRHIYKYFLWQNKYPSKNLGHCEKLTRLNINAFIKLKIMNIAILLLRDWLLWDWNHSVYSGITSN